MTRSMGQVKVKCIFHEASFKLWIVFPRIPPPFQFWVIQITCHCCTCKIVKNSNWVPSSKNQIGSWFYDDEYIKPPISIFLFLNSSHFLSPVDPSSEYVGDTPYDGFPLGSSRASSKRSSPYPLLGNKYTFITSSMSSQFGQLSGSFAFPRSSAPDYLADYDVGKNKTCDVTVTSYTRKWLCINRASPPCFMVMMRGTKYNVAEKICPQSRKRYGQSAT